MPADRVDGLVGGRGKVARWVWLLGLEECRFVLLTFLPRRGVARNDYYSDFSWGWMLLLRGWYPVLHCCSLLASLALLCRLHAVFGHTRFVRNGFHTNSSRVVYQDAEDCRGSATGILGFPLARHWDDSACWCWIEIEGASRLAPKAE